MNFKTEEVAALFELMQEFKAEFLHRKKAGQWKGIIFAIGEAFQEDKRELYSLAFVGNPKTDRTGPAPKIERRKPTGEHGQPYSKQPCTDCPPAVFGTGSAVSSATKLPPPPRHVKGGKEAGKAKPKEEEKQIILTEYESIEDVLDAFEQSSEAMIAFCQATGVSLPGNIKAPEKIAARILEAQNAPQ